MSAIKRILASGAALALICPIALASSARYSSREATQETFVISTVLSGEIRPLINAAAYMPASGATIVSIDVGKGASVEAGDVIGTYTLDKNPADIARAENALSQAQADMDYEISRRQAQVDEYMAQSAAQTDPDQARIFELKAEKTRLEAEMYVADARSNIAGLEAELESVRADSKTQEIKAPISGVIDKLTSAGIPAEQGQLLAAMHDPGSALVRVTDFAGDLRYGMTVDLRLTIHSSSSLTSGVVVSCDSVLPASLRSGAAYIAYDAAEYGSAFSSATVSVDTLRVENAVTVSNQTLSIGGSGYCVQILDDDGTLRTRYVNKGFENDSDVWILSGVNSGDKLIIK